jgi:hypothetical protein
MRRKSILATALGSLAMDSAAVSVVTASPVYTIDETGLTGTNYGYSVSGGTYQDSLLVQLNAAGQVTGDSARFDSSGDNLGQDSWFYDGSTTQQIGLSGTNYSYSDSGGTYQSSMPQQLNAAGQVIGYSYRYSSSGDSLGLDAWLYSGNSTQQIGLTGTNYSFPAVGGTYQVSAPVQLNSAGQAIGTSARYDNSGDSLGQDSWFFNGSSTQQIGLTGSNYSYAAAGGTFQQSDVYQLNAAGQVIGDAFRYSSTGDSLGIDAWLYNGNSTQQIGLSGTNYSYPVSDGIYQSSEPLLLNSVGQVAGYSTRYTSSGTFLGTDSWLFNGSSTQQIGLGGTNYSYSLSGGTFESSEPLLLNAAGQVAGYSTRYSSAGGYLGQDSWYYNGSSTKQIGLTGTNYSYPATGGNYQNSQAQQLNAAGQVIGYSTRYSSIANNLGQDAWIYNGSVTQQIGLTGTNYSYAATGGTYQYSNASQLNAAGQAIGYSSRYDSTGNSLGQDGWFFDLATDKTTLLQFSVDSATQNSQTDPQVLTDAGVVLGSYELYSGAVDEGQHAFYWSQSNGFSDLGALVSGGLSAAGWQDLSDVFDAEGSAADGSPLFIAGDGLISGQSGGNSTYLLSQNVPEPRAGSLVLLAGSGVFLRRRRKQLA